MTELPLRGAFLMYGPLKLVRDHSPSVVSVPIGSLSPADSPRFGGVDAEHARALAEAEGDLPPIVVRRADMRVIDGMHRLTAAGLRGQANVCVQFFDGGEDEAFLLAVESNVTHGLPLNIAERRAAAARIIRAYPHMSDRSVAVVSGLAAKTVAAVRGATAEAPQLNARVGRDGRVRPLSTAQGRQIAGQLFVEQPESSLRRVARQAGISVGTARDVRDRIRRGDDPTLPRQRSGAPVESAPAGKPATTGRRADDLVDHRTLLNQLRQDPSLRYTDAGRDLLRWLCRYAITTADWETAIADIPPHCAINVARMARSTAQAWSDFADALEELVQDCA
jgi:hypothetical protein